MVMITFAYGVYSPIADFQVLRVLEDSVKPQPTKFEVLAKTVPLVFWCDRGHGILVMNGAMN